MKDYLIRVLHNEFTCIMRAHDHAVPQKRKHTHRHTAYSTGQVYERLLADRALVCVRKQSNAVCSKEEYIPIMHTQKSIRTSTDGKDPTGSRNDKIRDSFLVSVSQKLLSFQTVSDIAD